MGKAWTLDEIVTKLQDEYNLAGEDFITNEELVEYINFGIDLVESKIHSLNEDYFLSTGSIDLEDGTQNYDLPSDIYANKLRLVYYSNGSKVYTIREIKDLRDVLGYEGNYLSGCEYRFLMLNDSTEGVKLRLYPRPAEDTLEGVKFLYIRNAKRLSENEDICDIPEHIHYVFEAAGIKIRRKEMLSSDDEKIALAELENKLVNDLTPKIIDNDTELSLPDDVGEYFEEF